jgi:hypothetical protein
MSKKGVCSIPIIICGFPHSGTTILQSIIGHIDEVDIIFKETDYINPTILNNNKHKFVLAKTPYLKDKIFTKKYENYIKIIIARNPCYVYSSLNRRFNYDIREDHRLQPHYINFITKIFMSYSMKNYLLIISKNSNKFLIK